MKAQIDSKKSCSKKDLMKIIKQIDEDRRQSVLKSQAGTTKSNRKTNG